MDNVPFCFWCKKPKDKSITDTDIHGAIYDYDPCCNCKDIFDKGILVIGVTEVPVEENLTPIAKDQRGKPWYPDSTYFVAPHELVRTFLKDQPEYLAHTLETKKLLMPSLLLQRFVANSIKEDYEGEGNQSGASNSDPRECD